MFLKNIVFVVYCVSLCISMDTVFLEEHLQPWTMCIKCISKEHLQSYIWIHLNTFEYIWGFLQWSSIFKGFVTLCKKHLLSSLFFKGIELIRNSSCSHSFDEWLFFYYKRTIAATHSFKFTVFLQNRNCSKEIS